MRFRNAPSRFAFTRAAKFTLPLLVSLADFKRRRKKPTKGLAQVLPTAFVMSCIADTVSFAVRSDVRKADSVQVIGLNGVKQL
jgi:hypothetical protein